LRGAQGDEVISFAGRDCFAEFILSTGEGLAMTGPQQCPRIKVSPYATGAKKV
jgi:hypothetical protein